MLIGTLFRVRFHGRDNQGRRKIKGKLRKQRETKANNGKGVKGNKGNFKGKGNGGTKGKNGWK
jgi:hypothetical protein